MCVGVLPFGREKRQRAQEQGQGGTTTGTLCVGEQVYRFVCKSQIRMGIRKFVELSWESVRHAGSNGV